MIRFASGGFDEAFDLRAPLGFDLGDVQARQVGDEGIILEVIPVPVHEGGDRLARQDGLAHCQNKVDPQPKLGRFHHSHSDICCSGGDVHHTSG